MRFVGILHESQSIGLRIVPVVRDNGELGSATFSGGFVSSLCELCRHCRVVVSGKGSRFFLCQRALTDARYAKYPPQPIYACIGYEDVTRDEPAGNDDAANPS